MTGIEPVTPSLPRKCSTSEPHQHLQRFICPLQLDSLAKAPEKVKHNFHIFQIFLNIYFFLPRLSRTLPLIRCRALFNGLG